MTPEQIEELGPAFAEYLQPLLYCCGDTRTFDHLGVYCRGLLSDLPRKTAEPIALEAGVAVRSLQEFLRDHVWSFADVGDHVQYRVASLLPCIDDDLGTVGIIDETGTVKKGTKTPGVQRQYCGEVGKIENCIVTVHLGVARGLFKTLIDADLFLPKAWHNDRERCQEAGIPDDIVYRPKWQIALSQYDRAVGHGIDMDWLTFDEYYGSKPGFLRGLDDRKQRYIGEVPKSFACYGREPRGKQKSSRADDLVRHSPLFTRQEAVRISLRRQTLAEQQWDVKAARVWLRCGGRRRRYWLIWAVNVQTGEEKYFISNAPKKTSLMRLMQVAFRRWNVEHGIRLSKSEIGFRHYEGRNYTGLMRHLTLCLVTLTFAAEQAQRLRGEKSGGNGGAGVPGVEPAMPAVPGSVEGNESVAPHVWGHHLPPAA